MISKDTYITASMATISSRKKTLQKVVDSLLPQVDKLNIYLNYRKEEDYPSLCDDPKLNLVHAGKDELLDLGCNGKFYFLDGIEDGYIFTVDDDLIYPSDYVENLCKRIEEYHRKVIVGYHGGILPKHVKNYSKERNLVHCIRPLDRDMPVNILGTGVIAFHKSTLNLSLNDFKSQNCADLWFALFSQQQNVPMLCVRRNSGIVNELVYPRSIWSQRKKLEKRNNELARRLTWKVYKYNCDDCKIEELGSKEIEKNILRFKKYARSFSMLKANYKIDMTLSKTKQQRNNHKERNDEQSIVSKEDEKIFLVHVNTKYHFETVASFIYIALAKGLKVHVYMEFPDHNRRRYLKDLFEPEKIKYVKYIDYSIYSAIVFITYYPDRFPTVNRLKYITNKIKYLEDNMDTKLRVYLATHEFSTFREEDHLKRHKKMYTLCYLSPLGYKSSKKLFNSNYILPVYFLKSLPEPKNLEKFNKKPKVILIQGNISTERRNYESLIEIAQELEEENFYFKIMGKGDIRDIRKLFKNAPKDKFKFLLNLPDDRYLKECSKSDFIMPLVDQSYKHEYFKSKLTSSITICYGFNLIPILHMELANIYKLPGNYTYTDGKESRIESVKKALSIDYDTYLEIKKKMSKKYGEILDDNVSRLDV